jgi:peptidoglycan hydrolase-like protein with peptidoglycan-binding domain
MSPETREAIRDFQTRMGLLADGIVSPETQQALVDEGQKLSVGGAPSQEDTEFLPAAEFAPAEQPDLEFGEPELEFSLSSFPATVQEALRNRREGVAVKLAIAYGYRDENQLSNLVFFVRHPERDGKALSQNEPNFQQLSREWISIRDAIVRPALRGGTGTPPPAGISTGAPDIVSVRGIKVARQIAPQVEALLAAAEADEIRLSGGGYRSAAAQIELRRKHCGPTHYDIWEKPSSQCKPPTARPGRSNHEKGLAIDFTYNGATIKSRDNPGFRWLAANAGCFGLYNLPSEPWHWSVDGN